MKLEKLDVSFPVRMAADESWYLARDARKRLNPHCPLAANEKCPRYYLSVKHAAAAHALSQDLSGETRSRIEGVWEASDVFASTELSVETRFGRNGSLNGVDGFCPEVTARILGLYCSALSAYPDGDVKTTQHKLLSASNAPESDPRWEWMVVQPRHYTECFEYSVYSQGKKPSKPQKRSLAKSLRWAVLERDGRRCVYCGKTPQESELHVDHKVSVADGGSDSLDNLVTACAACNLGKGAKSVTC